MVVGGPFFQVCWVVRDVERARREFGARYGVRDWLVVPEVRFEPGSGRWRGAPFDYTITVALGYAGGQQVELIEPRGGVSLYSEHLERFGPGLHHVGWVPEDFDGALAEARAASIGVLAQGAAGGMEFAYLDGGPLGSCVELMRLSDEMKAMFDRLIPEGFSNPWR